MAFRMCWVSVVGRGTWAVQSGVQISAGAENFSLLSNVQTASGCHPPSYLMGTGIPFGGKAVRV